MPGFPVPKIWPDSTVYIIGGGWSLRADAGISEKASIATALTMLSEFLKPIHNKRSIGVNDAFMLGDWVDVCWFGDNGWYEKNKTGLAEFAGLKLHCVNSAIRKPGCHRLNRGKPYGLEARPGYISWNHNSGASAINAAVHLGAKKIILLGFDMKKSPGHKNNWHERHEKKDKRWNPYPRFMKGFPHIKREAKKMNVQIINATTDTDLKEFPIVPIKEALGWE
jgi:hypothetical protein